MASVFETTYFTVELPTRPHVTRSDGGHLVVIPKHRISDRTELTPAQAVDLIRTTMLVGEAMRKGLQSRGIPIGRINYQDNGNWSPHFHVHIYGRATNALVQPFGHALHFPLPETGFYDNNEPLTDEDISTIQKKLVELAQTEKYAWDSCPKC
jgi:diadenosine tetraphosphate (Ap4A) HIT family hydrolase